ncbi:hypothetical protein NL676_033767 [Syzygium grande]|nr:hypothetical protein NL676_033767 [Syzygium grande]
MGLDQEGTRLKRLELNLLNVPAPPELASLSHLEELTLCRLDLETLVQLPSSLLRLKLQSFSIRRAGLLPSCLKLRNLWSLEFCHGEVEDIPLDGLPQLEELIICSCKRLQRLSIPLELRKLRQASVSSCPELVEIQVVGLSKLLKTFCAYECKSLIRISGLPYLKNLENFAVLCCNVLSDVEGLHELESLKSLVIRECTSLRRCRISLESYREEILIDTSDKTKTEHVKKARTWWKKIRIWRTSKESGDKEKENEKEESKKVVFNLDLRNQKEWNTVYKIIRECTGKFSMSKNKKKLEYNITSIPVTIVTTLELFKLVEVEKLAWMLNSTSQGKGSISSFLSTGEGYFDEAEQNVLMKKSYSRYEVAVLTGSWMLEHIL